MGGSAKDTITLPATGSFRVDGGTGDDAVTDGKSTALVMGSDGDDTVVGGRRATIVGGAGDDTFVDGPGSRTTTWVRTARTPSLRRRIAEQFVSLTGSPTTVRTGRPPTTSSMRTW